jgi:O-antigen/teichoic acid export membrane protein
MSLFKRLMTFSKYGIVSLIEKAINYLTVISLTYFISPQQVGLVSFFLAIYSFIFPFINMSTNGYLLVQWQVDNKNFKSYFSSSIRLNGLVAILVILLSLIFITFFNSLVDLPMWVFLGIPFMGYLESVKNNFLSYTIVKNNFWQYAIINISYTIILFVTTFLLIVYVNPDFTSRVLSNYVTIILIVLIIVYLVRKENLKGIVNKVYVVDALKYGILLIPHAIGLMVLDISDRFFIKKYAGEYDLGIYSIAYSLASLLSLISTSFFTAWVPRLNNFLYENTEQSKRAIVKAHKRYILVMFLSAIMVYIFAFIALKCILDPKYAVSLIYLPIIIASYFFQGIYLCFAGIMFYFKKNVLFMWASLLNITINTTLNYLLIPTYGATGAAVSTLLSMFVFTSFIAYFSNRLYPLSWFKNLKLY